jgi:nitric oxide reductase NorD protein
MRHHVSIDLLRWLLTGLLGREMLVVAAPASCESGQPQPRRAVLAPGRLLLPHGLATSDVGRAAMAHAVAHLKYSAPGRPIGSLKPMSIAVISTLEDTRVERLLARELPGVRRWFDDAIGSCPLAADDLSFAGLLARLDRALAEPQRVDGHFWVEKARELFEGQAASDLYDYDAFRRIGSVLANDLGQLRVPFRAQLYTVPAPHRDDNGYLWQLPDPPDPPSAVSVTSAARRPDEERGSAPRKDMAESSPQVELARFCYPEWDERAGIQRENWATVLERRPAWRTAAPRAPDHAIDRCRLILRVPRRTARTSWRRTVEGEHLDLNAAVDTLVALRSRQSPDARLFRAAGMQAASSSVLVLLDLSESTNDCVSPGGPSLLALERAASLMLARAVGGGGTADRLAVHGFHSDGRENVGYYRLLDFDEALDDRAEAMIAQAPGRWSTRMGAALRHASHCLQGEPAERRGLLLVTDGAPSDVDSYAPAYLVEDARAAVHAARRTGLRVHALAVDPAADRYVRRIFGSGGYDIVDRPAMLPSRLRDAYMRLCHS